MATTRQLPNFSNDDRNTKRPILPNLSIIKDYNQKNIATRLSLNWSQSAFLTPTPIQTCVCPRFNLK
jgi:superfamily II DNA/RNA helicase